MSQRRLGNIPIPFLSNSAKIFKIVISMVLTGHCMEKKDVKAVINPLSQEARK